MPGTVWGAVADGGPSWHRRLLQRPNVHVETTEAALHGGLR